MKQYLTHIEALRGIAILLVVIYHIMPEVCPHGYFGVDIFLLISGYLLVGGLLKNEGREFRFVDFFKKKLLRLFPSLSVMSVCMLLVGLYFMSGEELLLAARTAFSSLCCYSNIFLAQESMGYFAVGSQTNPFLHTWYLSVIFQVYLLFALVACIFRPFSLRIKWSMYLVMGLASVGYVVYYRFILPQFQPHEEMVPLYFHVQSRIFEVVCGGGILLAPAIRCNFFRVLIVFTALLTVVYCCFSETKNLELLLIASILLLWLKPEGRFAGLLDNRVLSFFGKYSFSIYLWHWPVIVYRNYAMESVSLLNNILLFILCILLGVVAYYLVEKRNWRLWVAFFVWSLGVGSAYFIMNNEGVVNRLHPQIPLDSPQSSWHVRVEECPDYPDSGYKKWKQIGSTGQKTLLRLGSFSVPPSFLVMGDSHAYAFMPGMAELADKIGISGYYLPVYVTPFHNRMCGRSGFCFSEENAEALMAWLGAHPEITQIVLIQRWSIRLNHILNDESMPLRYDGSPVSSIGLYEDTERALAQFCHKLQILGRQVIIMTEIPPVKVAPAPYIRRALLHKLPIERANLICSEKEYYTMFRCQLETFHKMEQAGLCNVFQIQKVLLKNGSFSAYENNAVFMSDDDHISAKGAILYAQENYLDWLPLLCPAEYEVPIKHGVQK